VFSVAAGRILNLSVMSIGSPHHETPCELSELSRTRFIGKTSRRGEPESPLGRIGNPSERPHTGSMSLTLQPRTARELAYRLLEQHRTTGAWVHELLHRAFAEGTWGAPDRGLVTELVNGVVRRRATLSMVLAAVMPRPIDRVEDSLFTLLQLGAYQLVFLDRIPAFAAVHETVELTKCLGQRRWTNVVNGVMRGVTRLLTDEYATSPAEDTIPVAPGRYRRVGQRIFADRSSEPVRFISQAFSLPEWLAERWHARWSWADLLPILEAVNSPPVLYVRVNSRGVTPPMLLQKWRESGIDATEIAGLPALRVNSPGDVEQLPGFTEGWWIAQDLTAMQATLLLDPRPGERVWDTCAAPGTKTTQLAELVGDSGMVFATDVDAVRLQRVVQNASRLRLPNIQTMLADAKVENLPAGPFDAVLLDAPCSNTGVLHRRPEARWRIQPDDLGELSSLQRRLLHAALDRVRPGGRLVYSTCSIEPEENEQVVDVVARQRRDTTAVLTAHTYRPGPEGDGGFQALLQRTM